MHKLALICGWHAGLDCLIAAAFSPPDSDLSVLELEVRFLSTDAPTWCVPTDDPAAGWI